MKYVIDTSVEVETVGQQLDSVKAVRPHNDSHQGVHDRTAAVYYSGRRTYAAGCEDVYMATQSAKEVLEYADARQLVSALGTTPTRPWPLLIDDLLALRQLADDWDGQGAEAPKSGVIDAALQLAREFQTAQVPPADRVLAGVNGTVYFEWQGTDGYLEVEVMAGRAEGRAVRNGSDVTEVFALSCRSSPA